MRLVNTTDMVADQIVAAANVIAASIVQEMRDAGLYPEYERPVRAKMWLAERDVVAWQVTLSSGRFLFWQAGDETFTSCLPESLAEEESDFHYRLLPRYYSAVVAECYVNPESVGELLRLWCRD